MATGQSAAALQLKQSMVQLRKEASLKRLPASQTLNEFVRHILDSQDKDALVVGFPSKKDNPFSEKSGCLLL
jgi:hypothetical protein